MDAKKCDRCGNFYVQINAPADIKSQLDLAVSAMNKNKPKHITDVCDLCPECVRDFYNWLREGGRNGQNT